jgi:hypothetical protein
VWVLRPRHRQVMSLVRASRLTGKRSRPPGPSGGPRTYVLSPRTHKMGVKMGKATMTVLQLLSDESCDRWTQGTYGPFGIDLEGPINPACCWCLSGAVMVVYPDSYPVLVRIAHHLGLLPKYSNDLDYLRCDRRIEDWNDAPERTKDDVLAVCRDLGI